MFVLYKWESRDDIEPIRRAWNEKDDILRDCKQAVQELNHNLINRFLVVWEDTVE